MSDDTHRTIDQGVARLTRALKGFDPNQPRDDHGRWSDTGVAGAATEAIQGHVDSIDSVTSEISTHASDLKDLLDEINTARRHLAENIADYNKDFGPGTEDYDAGTYENDLAQIRKDSAENIAEIEKSALGSYQELSSHADKLSAHTRNLLDKVNALAPKARP